MLSHRHRCPCWPHITAICLHSRRQRAIDACLQHVRICILHHPRPHRGYVAGPSPQSKLLRERPSQPAGSQTVSCPSPAHVHIGLRLSVSVRLGPAPGCSRKAPTWTAADYASLWQSHHHEESYAVDSIEGAIPADLAVRATRKPHMWTGPRRRCFRLLMPRQARTTVFMLFTANLHLHGLRTAGR